ncbi:hypothetical protein [Aquimarina brevivitae]|uniref:Uncharacterized protein n=1 Tax=Aquimarina brevivitae TaxID=323412 RepID=A0A4Q7P3E8_9FLAO|nr:hypothetical protein [Aquimarina brevivitae]RZS93930.1 hypothetical protein EV197_2511 [Aquimarina brevivitae]
MVSTFKKLFLIFFLGFFACKSGYDSSSKNCTTKAQKEILVQAVQLFESKLQKRYTDISIEAAYFEFISDLVDKELSIGFFQDSLALKIRNLNLWTESTRSEKEEKLEKKIFNVDAMNPIRVKLSANFSTCLANSIDWKLGTSSFLRMNSKYRLSPRLAQKYLYRASEYDLRKFENRLAIVLGVYYQTMFNILHIDANQKYSKQFFGT